MIIKLTEEEVKGIIRDYVNDRCLGYSELEVDTVSLGRYTVLDVEITTKPKVYKEKNVWGADLLDPMTVPDESLEDINRLNAMGTSLFPQNMKEILNESKS